MPHKLTRTHVLLFIATFFSTLIAGATYVDFFWWKTPMKIYIGLPFSITLLSILLVHEFSHYFFSRKHKVVATLPYFIPAPSLVGTFGAIIKMKPPIPDRRALIDIGASGPIGGFIVAIAAVIIGLRYSTFVPIESIQNHVVIIFGDSILFSFLSKLVLNIDPEKYSIGLHPIAFAGWVGFLITSLNLLPIGQLDGGHIVYALFGENHSLIAKLAIPVLIVMGITLWPGWLVWAVLMLVMGHKHPPVVYPHIQLDKNRKIIGWVSFAIFILTFTPVPVQGF